MREIIDWNDISLLSPYLDSLLRALFADTRYKGKTEVEKVAICFDCRPSVTAQWSEMKAVYVTVSVAYGTVV